jgi:hypothetical protein
LDPFVQGMDGEEREMPRQPRWDRGVGKAAANVAAFLLGLVFALGPVVAVHTVGQYVVGGVARPTASQKGPTATYAPQLLRNVIQSPLTTLEGRAVPYRLEIPEIFVKFSSDDVMYEHRRTSPDGRMLVDVVAFNDSEDFSDLANSRMEINSKEGAHQVILKSTRTVSHAGVDWVESVVGGKLPNGDMFRETVRATSSPQGTVLLKISTVEFPDTNPIYERLTEQILKSFRFLERSGPDVKPTEPGPASGSPATSDPTSPPSEPTPPPEPLTPDLVARSARMTLQGRALPYQFEISEGLVKQVPKNEMIEHERKSPDGRLIVQVVAHDHQEDMSHLAEHRLKLNSGEGVLESKLKSARTVHHAGADWVEAALLVTLKDGVTVQELSRGTSGPRGTVLILVLIASSPESDPIYQRLASEMLQSFRFAD